MTLYAFFEHGRAPTDRAIQLLSHSVGHSARAPLPLANHTGLMRVWRNPRTGTVRRDLVEAVWPWARCTSVASKMGHDMRVYRCDDVSADPAREALAWRIAESLVGTPYNLVAVVRALYWCETGRSLRWVLTPRTAIDCVMIPARCVRGVGLPFCGLRPADTLTPAICETHALDYWTPVDLAAVLAEDPPEAAVDIARLALALPQSPHDH